MSTFGGVAAWLPVLPAPVAAPVLVAAPAGTAKCFRTNAVGPSDY